MHSTGRKCLDRFEATENLCGVGPSRRGTIRAVAAEYGLPLTSLFTELKRGTLLVATSVARPILTDGNMQQLLQFCLRHVESDVLFDPTEDVVHLREKLFFPVDHKGTHGASIRRGTASIQPQESPPHPNSGDAGSDRAAALGGRVD